MSRKKEIEKLIADCKYEIEINEENLKINNPRWALYEFDNQRFKETIEFYKNTILELEQMLKKG